MHHPSANIDHHHHPAAPGATGGMRRSPDPDRIHPRLTTDESNRRINRIVDRERDIRKLPPAGVASDDMRLEERRPDRLMQPSHRGPSSHPSAGTGVDMGTVVVVTPDHHQYNKTSPGSRAVRVHHSQGGPNEMYPEARGTGPGENIRGQIQQHHLDPSSAVKSTSRNRRKLETMPRNDSLSSDPSDCVRPPPPKPHKHRKKQRHTSLSSSDDEIRSTPECTSCDDQEIESESVSEKGMFAFGLLR